MESQAKAGPGDPTPEHSKEDDSAAKASNSATQSLESGVEKGENDHETSEDSAQGSEPLSLGKDGSDVREVSAALDSNRESQIKGDTLERRHSMPGKAEGLATAVEASPLLESMDGMVADTSPR